MSLNTELRHKYAYNINDTTKGKKFTIGTGKNFFQLHRGFYDELENKDQSIKHKERQLQKIKNDSLKEFVFTNVQIPEKWKTKINYQKDVIRILARDNNFLYYVGRGGPGMNETASTKMYTKDSFNKTGKRDGLKTSYSQIFPKVGQKYTTQELKKDLMSNNKTLEEEDVTNVDNTVSMSKKHLSKVQQNKKEAMNDKDIANLLEEFRLAYPIKLKKEDHDEFSPREENKISSQQQNFIRNKAKNLSAALLQTNKGYNPFDNIHKIRIKRQRAFRQNIFNNLLPEKNKNLYNSMINLKERTRKKKFEKKELSPFLNFDNEAFYKKVKITNPVIERQLENINYYGPYYSYCPPCLNRNLSYYNHLEPNQCLKLIQYIRKTRGKKNIITIKESKSVSSDKKTEKKVSSLEENVNDNDTIDERKDSIEFS